MYKEKFCISSLGMYINYIVLSLQIPDFLVHFLLRAHTDLHTHTHTHTYTHTHTHTHTHIHTHTYTHTHTNAHTHTHIHTHTHTNPHTYTHKSTHTDAHRNTPPFLIQKLELQDVFLDHFTHWISREGEDIGLLITLVLKVL